MRLIVDGQRVGGTTWLIELDNVLQHIMKIFRYGHNHAELRKICEEKKQVFLEFNLFSETRFVEYAHRTDVENLQNLLVQLEHVVNLLFMMDLSAHVLFERTSKVRRSSVLRYGRCQ